MGTFTKKKRDKQARNVKRARGVVKQAGTDLKFGDHLDLAGTKEMEGPLRVPATTPSTPTDAVPTNTYVDTNIHSVALAAAAAAQAANHNHPFVHTSEFEKHKRDLAASNTAKADGHSHQISFTPFMKYPLAERLAMLADRLDLELALEVNDLSPTEHVLAKNVLNLLKLLQDYRGFDAFERERRFKDPAWAEWTEDYMQVYGVDEYEEASRETFMAYGHVRMDPQEGIALIQEVA